MYNAIVAPVTNVREHPNAEALKLATVSGYQIVVGLDQEEGEMGVFFGDDGCLSEEMARENNLHRHVHLNKDPEAKAGFFEDNRRIKAVKLRGERSYGFWTPLSSLEWTGANLDELKKDDQFTELNGKLVCEKYYTRATREARKAGNGQKKLKKAAHRFPTFMKHTETGKLRMNLHVIPEGAVLQISEKCHGTSGRTGYLKEEIELSKFKKWWNKRFPFKFQETKYQYVSGSRNVTYDPDAWKDDGYYTGKNFRMHVHNDIVHRGLHKGETLYYEIVGYDDGGGLIMGSHPVSDKKLKKEYGDHMRYRYGCNDGSDDTRDKILYKVFVYRMTRTTEDGRQFEVPYTQLVSRCAEMGLTVVPELKAPFIYNGNKEELMNLCEALTQGCSTLDKTHIREGVVIRIEAPNVEKALKYKGWHFSDMEGIRKNTDSFVDIEEIS